MPDHYAKLTRAVVEIGTQLRRLADAQTTPVADTADAPTTTPDNGRRLTHWMPISPELAAQRAETMNMLERYIDSRPPCIPDHGAPVHCPGCAADDDIDHAPNLLRVLADRAARGSLSLPGEGEALRRRVEQTIDRGAKYEHITKEQRQRADQAEAALAHVRDAARLHRKTLISTSELYAVIEATEVEEQPDAR